MIGGINFFSVVCHDFFYLKFGAKLCLIGIRHFVVSVYINSSRLNQLLEIWSYGPFIKNKNKMCSVHLCLLWDSQQVIFIHIMMPFFLAFRIFWINLQFIVDLFNYCKINFNFALLFVCMWNLSGSSQTLSSHLSLGHGGPCSTFIRVD